MSILLEFISAYILVFFEILSWSNISKKEVKLNDYKIYIIAFIMTIIHLLNFHFISNFVKSIGIMITFILFCKVVFNFKLKNCIVISFICEFIIIIIEAVLLIIMSLLFNIDMSNAGNYIIAFVLDIIIGLLLFGVSRLSIINKLYKFIIRITSNIKIYQILFLFLFIMLGSSVIFASVYLKGNVFLILFLNILISILYTIIVIAVFNYHNRYYKINLKYNTSVDNLQLQEHIIDKYRIINHENKNQLLTIKAMTKNKKVERYINSLLKQKEKLNSELKTISLILPDGGIRGLIYSKMLLMKEKDIKCYLNVDKKIKSKLLANINDNDTVDICQILGVLIDNSIEEVENMNKKEISMDIHLNDNEVIICISNSYNPNNHLNLTKKVFKSNKEKGHGYGLQLVKKLISKNNKLSNEYIITKDTFTQIIKIML